MGHEKRDAAGQKLLDAAQEFWNACHEEGQYGAVQWLQGSSGELLIFTRGEYRAHLMESVTSLPCQGDIHFFDSEEGDDHANS